MICLLLLAIAGIVQTLFLYTMWKKLFDSPDQRENATDEEETLYGSEEVQEVNRTFSERIQRMKDELEINSDAMELHPLVKNLPHDSVKVTPKPNHEYAE